MQVYGLVVTPAGWLDWWSWILTELGDFCYIFVLSVCHVAEVTEDNESGEDAGETVYASCRQTIPVNRNDIITTSIPSSLYACSSVMSYLFFHFCYSFSFTRPSGDANVYNMRLGLWYHILVVLFSFFTQMYRHYVCLCHKFANAIVSFPNYTRNA